MTRLYQYVGPARILEQPRHQPPGFEVRTLAELRVWLLAHGGVRGREITVTFVIDEAGMLRIADRHSEHVACSSGGPVRSAGEMTFAVLSDRIKVASVSNQSTGFCPEPSSWIEVQQALDGGGVKHPGGFTEAFEFRRCPVCSQTNLIKEEVFRCDACDGELPRGWNYGE